MFPSQFYNAPDKAALTQTYVGKSLDELPTPSVVIDRSNFMRNSQAMLTSAARIGAGFRCHIKTHKTTEGVKIQLGHGAPENAGNSPIAITSRIVVSTLAEAWAMLPLAAEGKVTDILFGLPIAKSKIPELHELSKHVQNLRVMVDSTHQVDALYNYAQHHENLTWSLFIKVDMGYCRAGVREDDAVFDQLLQHVLDPTKSKHVSLYGLYCHAGHSYGAHGAADAEKFLIEELTHVNNAAKKAQHFSPGLQLCLSVGATPTAHVTAHVTSRLESVADLEAAIGGPIVGHLELHAGNYACCDLQQVATGLVEEKNLSLYLLAEVLTAYEGRNGKVPGEQLINAGAIALSREVGPLPGHGKVVKPAGYGSWIVGKVSQEHGILYPQDEDCRILPYGQKVLIIPQHACITACAHAWYFVVEDDKVVDVWVPAKLW